jgi:glucan phosphoethanolaminetransferase (alkaline phosphatase superfamily)
MDNKATSSSQTTRPKWQRRAAWATLFLLTLIVLASVAIPVGLIMPFRTQSQDGLALSFTLKRWSPSLTVVVTLMAIGLVIWLWRGTRWWRKPALVVSLLVIFAATWFARQNHFEWMFHPLPNAVYAKVTEAAFMTDPDMVLAVENGGEAVAYPVRLMAYHHVIQDTVGGTPLVATY